MIRIERGQLESFQFEPEILGIKHGFFTRDGGISPNPWNSLNLSTTAGDSVEDVIENRKRIFDFIGKPVESLYDVWQVHSTQVIITDKPRGLNNEPIQADGIITSNPDVVILMRFADCVPIIFWDEIHKVIGMAHAGWKGTVNKITEVMIDLMTNHFKSNPSDILMAIGPSICPKHYLVRDDVIREVINSFPGDWNKLISEDESGHHLDLRLANQLIAEKMGVSKVHQSYTCTACDTTSWFSHRAEHGVTGRFGAVATLG
jgi:YfiH family protein